MNAKHIIRSIGLVFLLLFAIVPIAASAQEITVLDGAKPLSHKSARVDGAAIIAKSLHFPAISPDGKRVLLYEPGLPGVASRVHEWKADTHLIATRMQSDRLSRYMSWDRDDRIAVRDGNQPFARDAVPRNAAGLRAYDDDDTIRLETPNGIVTVSAPGERAYAPFLSPDSRYVVYNVLGRGLVLYDIAKRAPVLIAKHATWPAFSPDGGYLVYAETTDDGHALTRGDLVILDLRSRTAHRIANPNHEIRTNATLSHDGRRIAYETDDDQVWVADVILE